MFEKINTTELCAVGALGIALIAAIIMGKSEAALAIGGALSGYIGGIHTTKGE